MLLGCSTPKSAGDLSGKLTEKSEEWTVHNTCDCSDNDALCQKIVSGPALITEIKVAPACIGNQMVAIASSDRDQLPRWQATGKTPKNVWLHNVKLKIEAEESLFWSGTCQASSQCNIRWHAEKIK